MVFFRSCTFCITWPALKKPIHIEIVAFRDWNKINNGQKYEMRRSNVRIPRKHSKMTWCVITMQCCMNRTKTIIVKRKLGQFLWPFKQIQLISVHCLNPCSNKHCRKWCRFASMPATTQSCLKCYKCVYISIHFVQKWKCYCLHMELNVP